MSATDYTGQTIDGRYRIIRLLGEGGMGAVYLGEHVVIGKQVAVKFLHTEYAGKEEVVKRFYREAQAAAAIGHKNIIDVVDVGVSPQGEPYMVMEYLVGESLANMLERTGPIDLAAACGIMEPTLLALAAAHEKGIVHRDLKPENIFLVYQEGESPAVKLIDFGISKFTHAERKSKITLTGSAIGTPAYMSPEQVRGSADVNHLSDIYSVGVILYEVLLGRPPIGGEQYNEVLINVLTTDPVPPRDLEPNFPLNAQELILNTLAKEPEKRPQSAKALLEELKKLKDFGQRNERLTVYSSSVPAMTFAGGDLGEKNGTQGSGPVAADVLSEMVEERTPGAWATTGETALGRRRLMYATTGIGVILVLGVALFWGLRSDKSAQNVPLTPATSQSGAEIDKKNLNQKEPQGVEITLKGVPEGAEIYYSNSLVPMNPFRVEKSNTLVPLRVELRDFEPFRYAVLPSEDRVIEVTLKALDAGTPKPLDKSAAPENAITAEEPASKTKRRRASSKKTKNPTRTQRFREGGRGTVFSETFE